MKIRKYLFPFLVVCFLGNNLFAQIYFDDSDSLQYEGKFFWGAYAGIPSYNTFGRTTETVEMNFGYKQMVVTGRFYRTNGNGKYFFEDAFEAGWKKLFWNGFSSTLSIGISDLAFEKDILSAPDFSSSNFYKREGFVTEEKLAYNFHWKNGAPSVWGLAANYYFILNSAKPIQGLSAGIDFVIDNMYWKNPLRKPKRKRIVTFEPKQKNENEIPECDAAIYKNRIRTNFITGMFFSPHLDFEHRYNKHWGWGISFFVRPDYNRNFYQLFDASLDFALSGGGGFADLVYYKPTCTKNHYWTFALRCGYRNLSGDVDIGGTISTPDHRVYRERQDIVTDWRASYVMAAKSHWCIDFYFMAGLRTSFYYTSFPSYPDLRNYFDGSTGCYIRQDFTGGLEMGFGW